MVQHSARAHTWFFKASIRLGLGIRGASRCCGRWPAGSTAYAGVLLPHPEGERRLYEHTMKRQDCENEPNGNQWKQIGIELPRRPNRFKIANKTEIFQAETVCDDMSKHIGV